MGLLLSARRAGEIDQLLHVAPLLQVPAPNSSGATAANEGSVALTADVGS